MSVLRPPQLGPIIGHTTDTACRLWIQAGVPDQDAGPMSPMESNRRSVGVIGVLSKDKASVEQAYYFRLHRQFDRAGTFMLGADVQLGRYATDLPGREKPDRPYKLEADTPYTVRMATLSIDDPLPDEETLLDSELIKHLPDIENIKPMLLKLRPEDIEKCEVTFRTFPKVTPDSLSFLLGSCRYPGMLWKIKEADRIFGPMHAHLAPPDGRGACFTLMVGDQIYADTLNRFVPIGLADTYEEFQERYQTAFGSSNMRRLLKTAPTYMILDDHEIADNWTQDRLKKDANHRLFNLAIGAYMSYQWCHSPRTYSRQLYYNFECGGYPFFVLDVRTQRYKDDREGLDDNHMLGRPSIDPAHPGQLKIFLDWLSEQQRKKGNTPKFVVSSSVFAPTAMSERLDQSGAVSGDPLYEANRERREDSDSWPCFPNTRKAIIEHIVTAKIQNVVFLTGDIHCANIARLSFTVGGKDSGIVAYDVTSSAFYWPFPFADGDPNDFVHDSTLPGQLDPLPFEGGVMNYRAWAFTQEDNFARIEIDRKGNRLGVRYYNRDGVLVPVTDEQGKSKDKKGNAIVENWLPLAL